MESKVDIESIIFKLNVAMDFNWLYKDPELDLTKLAAHLGVSYSVLSKVIKSYYGLGFRAYINQLRIDKLLEIISSFNTILSIEQSMKISGFKSRVTFFNAFKSRTGMSFTIYWKANNLPKKNELPIFYAVDDQT
ncbi:Helix-turn-helix domain-containing protein [Belliella buryatensis]|uniref:Helix-turn-helix domain-containing protein n=1 Tax=Belliella buryatensis TaxID=1500549 RepID=A0A239H1F4_9BACT|nr:helix-turn-helix domain-containing protein [Belliella buryatensis]SNS75296.1 Helix-turn-helix domain-containing protein [Belliella buryatensis]